MGHGTECTLLLWPIFRNKNYNTITVADICREAEISRGTFYAHFRCILLILKSQGGKSEVRKRDHFSWMLFSSIRMLHFSSVVVISSFNLPI